MNNYRFAYSFILAFIFNINTQLSAKNTYNVHINGKIISTKLSKIRVRYFDYILQQSKIISETDLDSSNNFELHFFLSKPQYFQLGNSYVWISPNDSVSITMNDENLITHAIGKNKYNYLIKSNLQGINYTKIDRNSTDWQAYYGNLSNEYNERIRMINMYKDSIDIEYKKYLEIDTKYNIIHRKLVPVRANFISRSSAYSFIKDIDSTLFNKNLIYIYGYSVALKEFYDYRLGNNKDGYTKSNLEIKYNLINDLFKDKDREALVLLVLNPFVKQNTEPYLDLIKNIFLKEKEVFKDTILLNHLQHLESITKITNQPFTKEMLSTKLKDKFNNNITLDSIIKKNKNKVIVIDFWATWCGACIEAFPMLLSIQKLTENREVSYVFISFDRKYEDWIKGKKRWPKSNFQYFLPEGFNSLLCRNLYFTGIPRTIIINKQGNLAVYNAPSPMNGTKLYELIKSIESHH